MVLFFRCACAVAGAVLLNGCDGASPPSKGEGGGGPAEQRPIAVEAAAVRLIDFPRIERITGTLFGDEQTTLAAKVAGRVTEIHRDLGDSVRPGEPLIVLDATDYELAAAERASALHQALAKLGLSAIPAGEFDVASLPAVERARLQAENAKNRFERGRKLAERTPPLISEQAFADLQTEWEVAKSNLDVARLEAEAGIAEARVLEAQLRIAEQRVKDAIHRAPTEASDPARVYAVAERLVAVGDYVQPGDALLRLVDLDPIKLRADVPQVLAGVLAVGQAATVRLDGGGEAVEGRVERISPVVDDATRTFVAEVVVSNPGAKLKPGGFATADVRVGTSNAPAVPESAVLSFAGVRRVLVIVNGAAEDRRVELGDRRDGWVEVRQGLTEGEVVVVRPPEQLAPGMPVTHGALMLEPNAPPGEPQGTEGTPP